MRHRIWLVLISLALCSLCWIASAEEIATPSDFEDNAVNVTETTPAKPSAPKHTKRKPTLYEIPDEVLAADANFAALMAEAEKYIGYPYVWGGSSPETSFDCSGFVCWVFRASGVYDTGRRGATGLFNLCSEVSAEDARPGDLVFFQGTMGDVEGITHVGIYVGNHWMIHCGDPIGFADLSASKWQRRLYAYGRLPY